MENNKTNDDGDDNDISNFYFKDFSDGVINRQYANFQSKP